MDIFQYVDFSWLRRIDSATVENMYSCYAFSNVITCNLSNFLSSLGKTAKTQCIVIYYEFNICL